MLCFPYMWQKTLLEPLKRVSPLAELGGSAKLHIFGQARHRTSSIRCDPFNIRLSIHWLESDWLAPLELYFILCEIKT